MVLYQFISGRIYISSPLSNLIFSSLFVSFKPETNHPLDRRNQKPVTAVTDACKWTATDRKSQTVSSVDFGIWDQTPAGTTAVQP